MNMNGGMKPRLSVVIARCLLSTVVPLKLAKCEGYLTDLEVLAQQLSRFDGT